IDVIGADGVISDFKTASRAWPADRAQKELQTSYYLAALNQMGFTNNPEMRFRHIIWTKTAKPQVQIFETRRTVVDLFRLLTLIQNVWRAIEAGAFPINPDAWLCSPRYCANWEN